MCLRTLLHLVVTTSKVIVASFSAISRALADLLAGLRQRALIIGSVAHHTRLEHLVV